MRLAMLTAFWWTRAKLCRAWFHTFGCQCIAATRPIIAGDETRVRVVVNVHCHRCWRRYTKSEQDQAVKYLQETTP